MAFSLFSKKERRVFFVLVGILLVSALWMLNDINQNISEKIPVQGGVVSEGILGTPRFVNPVLASSDADKDVVMLVYSGLMRKSNDGSLVSDLADGYEISEDGLTYTFFLRDDLYFHDGAVLTADDVVFTIEAIKDPIIKSPHRGDWDGIVVEKVDNKTIRFHLKQTYASFLENTTLGIMPKHIWEDSPIELSEANNNPVGSGPYKISKVNKQSSGVVESYELKAFKDFALGEPYITKINLKFYSNEERLVSALRGGAISQASSISPENAEVLAERGYTIEASVLPRIFGLFLNQNQKQLFTDKKIVEAIDKGIDKDRIVRQVLEDYGTSIDSPVPQNLLKPIEEATFTEKISRDERIAQAREILISDGWEANENGILEKGEDDKERLEFIISTGNAEELVRTAELVQEDLSDIGMLVEVRTFEVGNLNQTIIRPRKYDVLLFGQIVSSETDLFAFWHSSQRNDPGLNVSMYTSSTVDELLEEAFVTVDIDERKAKYRKFEQEIQQDRPAVFLYSPELIYVISNRVKGLDIENISSPSDRFRDIHMWYIKEDKIWKIFSQNNI